MLQTSILSPLSAMDPATMRAVFNHLAAERNKPGAPRDADRFTLGKGIALLRATPKPKAEPIVAKAIATVKQAVQRTAVIRDFALRELAAVRTYRNAKVKGPPVSAACFEAGNDDSDDWESFGATYFEIVKTIRAKYPKSRISANVLRQFTHHIKTVAAMEAEGRPIPPTLEPFRNVVLPERRPKSSSGVKPHGTVKAEPRKPARARARVKPAGRNAQSKKPRAKRGRANDGRRNSKRVKQR